MNFDVSTIGFMIIPLLVGGFATPGDWQTTFSQITIDGNTLVADELKDTITLNPGFNVDFVVDNSTDSFTINANATRQIEVQTDPWYVSNTIVENNKIYFVSDGSITFNVTKSYP